MRPARTSISPTCSQILQVGASGGSMRSTRGGQPSLTLCGFAALAGHPNRVGEASFLQTRCC